MQSFTFKIAAVTFLLVASTRTGAPADSKPAVPVPAATSKSGDSDKAWQDVLRDSQPPQPPDAWKDREPSPAEFDRFRVKESERLIKAAARAKAFHSQFPKDARADQAQFKEYELLGTALQLGATNVLARLDEIDQARLKDPQLAEEERFQIRLNQVNRMAMSKMAESRAAALSELETGARGLLKDFPSRTEPYEMLLMVVQESDPDHAAKLAKELAEGAAPESVKAGIKPFLSLGKPVAIKFTAVNGEAIDLEKFRGKVVLIDFWATWCGPCIQELPNVRAAYEKLHPKGFEIIGISFDREKEALVNFTRDQKMPWPQYFDGKQWDNEFGKQFGIQSIPTMWLVDKKGNLRDLNGREDLAAKVEKLLGESVPAVANSAPEPASK